MASFAGLLELSGPQGHTVRDFPPGVLHAAAQTLPPGVFVPFVRALLNVCSTSSFPGPIRLSTVLTATYGVDCPGVSPDDLHAFRRRIVPRNETVAELEGYTAVGGSSRLRHLEPRLRQLLDSALENESESVRVAVLQHFVDRNVKKLIFAPYTIERMLNCKHESWTIPDDPRLHQLLRQLLASIRAELPQRAGHSSSASAGNGAAAATQGGAAAGEGAGREAAPVLALGQRTHGGSSGSEEGAWPDTPPSQAAGCERPAAAPRAAAAAAEAPGSGGGTDDDGSSIAAATAPCGMKRRWRGEGL